MDSNTDFTNAIFEIEPDEQGLLIELAFMSNGTQAIERVSMRIKGTLVVTILDGMTDEKIEAAKQAVRDFIANKSRTAGVLLSSMGKTPQDLVAEPYLLNTPLDVGFSSHVADLAPFGVGVHSNGVNVTSVVIADSAGTTQPPANATGAWTCSYCNTSGHTGKFCDNCGAPRQR